MRVQKKVRQIRKSSDMRHMPVFFRPGFGVLSESTIRDRPTNSQTVKERTMIGMAGGFQHIGNGGDRRANGGIRGNFAKVYQSECFPKVPGRGGRIVDFQNLPKEVNAAADCRARS